MTLTGRAVREGPAARAIQNVPGLRSVLALAHKQWLEVRLSLSESAARGADRPMNSYCRPKTRGVSCKSVGRRVGVPTNRLHQREEALVAVIAFGTAVSSPNETGGASNIHSGKSMTRLEELPPDFCRPVSS